MSFIECKDIKCKECGKVYPKDEEWINHSKGTTHVYSIIIYKYKCDKCGGKFLSWAKGFNHIFDGSCKVVK